MTNEELKEIQLGILNNEILVAFDKALTRRFLVNNNIFCGFFHTLIIPICIAIGIYSFVVLKWWGLLYFVLNTLITLVFQGDCSFRQKIHK